MSFPVSPREGPAGVVIAEVTDEVLDGGDLLRELGAVSDGAVLVFEGRVRDHNEGQRVVRLAYDAYREMADAVLHEIAGEALRATGASAVAVRHRVGTLSPPDVSLVVAVASPHRQAAYEASTLVIEQLKKRLPVWKKEEYADGTRRWLGDEVPAAESGRSRAVREDG